MMLCQELLAYHVESAEAAHRIAATLNSNCPSHSYPILLN